MSTSQEQHSSVESILGRLQEELTDWSIKHLDLTTKLEDASYRAGMHHDADKVAAINREILVAARAEVHAHLRELIHITKTF